jgi:DeoR family fructose operon transcriptional repressor
MYPAERHAAILAGARNGDGALSVAELSDRLAVTPETIRRDLVVLERQGLVRRHHGGAVLAQRTPFEPSLQHRREGERTERAAVAALVVERLPHEGVIVLDSGAMTLEIAALLPDDRRLLVVTNSLPIIALLGGRPRLTVLALPGRVRAVTQATVGAWTVARLAGLHADVAVIGANGVGVTAGATTTLPEEAEVKQAMLGIAKRRILAVTSAKFATTSFHRAAGLEEFDQLVTDDGLDPDTVAALADSGPELLLATT